ncbi:MAG: YHS domain-containing protein [Acidobacteria bacterium]|nr:YHS domain-containing protein [Acidobacteriota bacterium]MDW7983769.1 YHS domain-containing protein [Acidobacteriota bacterium]
MSSRKVPKTSARENRVRDPVCGMVLNLRYVEHFTDWQGVRYSFCSLSCKLLFDQDPDYYIRIHNSVSGTGP